MTTRTILNGVIATLFGDQNAVRSDLQKICRSAICFAAGQSEFTDVRIEANSTLDSIFSSIGNRPLKESKNGIDSNAQYIKWKSLDEDLSDIQLLNTAEKLFSGVPVQIASSLMCDIPVYQLIRIAVALASCMVEKADSDATKKCFLLYSLDLSGIQKFIYSINTVGALKGLKARSIYLGLLMENVVDDILEKCCLSRANLLYSGGGRAHIVLPNMPAAISAAEKIVSTVNDFLADHYGIVLFLTSGHTAFSGFELISANYNHAEEAGLSDVFHKTAAMISAMKLSRYSFEEVCNLNAAATDSLRECAVCGVGHHLQRRSDGSCVCETCGSLEKFATVLKKETAAFIVTDKPEAGSIAIPSLAGKRFIFPGKALHEGIRRYSTVPEENSIFLPMSKFGLRSENETPYTLDDYQSASKGISRLGVYRCDVDSLGALFSNGFKRSNGGNPWRDYNLARYATLSAKMTFFFQCKIDAILKDAVSLFDTTPLDKVTVVYSGGDDVFMIGAWDQVLSAGVILRNAFDEYTGATVTLSGGLGLFKAGLPVPIMADDTEELVDLSKSCPGKNAVSLFGITYDNGRKYEYTTSWSEFNNNVLNDKFKLLSELFAEMDTEKGSAFLYRVVGLFRDIQLDRNKSALPRLAYTLARSEPDADADPQVKSKWKYFSKECFKWAMDDRESAAFRTASMLYIYLNRKQDF